MGSIDFKDFGIAIKLPENIGDEALKLANEISKKVDTEFVLGVDAIPHITISLGRFPKLKIDELVQLCKAIEFPSGFYLEMENNLFFRPNGNVFWNVKENQVLTDIHKKLVEELHKMSDGLLMDQFTNILQDPNAPQLDKDNILKYGSVLSGDRFMSHITLGRLKNLEDKNKFNSILPKPMRFSPKYLIVGELGKFGEVKNIEFEITLDK